MYRSKSLLRNLDSGVWIWNSAQIETLAITDNVVDLMQSKLRDLPEATRNLLGLAACAGHVFTLDELAVLSASAPQAVAQALWPALVMSLLDRNLPLITIWTLQEIRMRAYLISGKMQKASALGKTIFGQAGRQIPDTVEVLMAESVSMLKAIDAWRERLGEEGLAAIPLDSDPLRTTQDAATFFSALSGGCFCAIRDSLTNRCSCQ